MHLNLKMEEKVNPESEEFSSPTTILPPDVKNYKFSASDRKNSNPIS